MRKLIGMMAALGIIACVAAPSWAEEFKLPDAAEISTFPPEALQFYNDGLKALDHVDYVNAYDQFAKASQLAPSAIRLGYLTAALSIKQGRTKPAAEAKPYYETAINAYQNILRTPELDESLKRDAQNRLKIAMDERDNLAQRDVRREVMGNRFVQDLNRQYIPSTPKPSPKPGGAAAVPATPAAYPGQPANAIQAGGVPPISPFIQGTPVQGFPQQQPGSLGPIPGGQGGQPPPITPLNPQPAI